jgi:hypothetical protein
VSLADQHWTQTSIHEVVAAFLQAERHAFDFIPRWLPVVDNPNLDDPIQNQKRLRLLYLKRAQLMLEVPPDTQWWNVEYLLESDIDNLFTAARFGAPWCGQKLSDRDHFENGVLKSDPADWKRVILWGHERTGPFVILEGNHRLMAYARTSSKPPLRIPVYVGLSKCFCFWHPLDRPFMLANDILRTDALRLFERDDWIYRAPQQAEPPQ